MIGLEWGIIFFGKFYVAVIEANKHTLRPKCTLRLESLRYRE